MSKRSATREVSPPLPTLYDDLFCISDVAIIILRHLSLYQLCTLRKTCLLFSNDPWTLKHYDFYTYISSLSQYYWHKVPAVMTHIQHPLEMADACSYNPLVINYSFNLYAMELCKVVKLDRRLRKFISFRVRYEFDEPEEDENGLYWRKIRQREEEYRKDVMQEWNRSESLSENGFVFEIIYDKRDGQVDLLLIVSDRIDYHVANNQIPLLKEKRHCLINSLDLSYICRKNAYDVFSPIVREKFASHYCKSQKFGYTQLGELVTRFDHQVWNTLECLNNKESL